MKQHCRFLFARMAVIGTALVALTCNFSELFAADAISVKEEPGKLQILIRGQKVGTYVYQDEKTLRPHFSNLFTADGAPVTRHHPPRPDVDATDHAEMHPGVWLAFGEMWTAENKVADFWRNKGRVEHVEFVENPR